MTEAVAQLRRWEESGGRWRVLARSADSVVLALLTCDIGEEVDRLSATDPAFLGYLGTRTSSEDPIAGDQPGDLADQPRDRTDRPRGLTDRPRGLTGRSGDLTGQPGDLSARPRDLAGRPRNSRPRDSLGRPLPPGAAGVPTMPDDLDPSPVDGLRQAQQLLDDGFPFHAHEVLEAVWKSSPAGERELWRGLAQLAVGLTHARRGNTTGAARLLRRSADRIVAYEGSPPHGIAVTDLVAWARSTADGIDGKEPGAADRTPRLTTS